MTQVNTEKLIAESENISRNDRSTSRHQDTSGIQYGEEAVATPTAVIFRWGSEGGYAQGALIVPWPAVLEHAPTAELVRALVRRGAAASCHRAENHKEIVEWVDMLNWPGHTDVVLVPLELEP